MNKKLLRKIAVVVVMITVAVVTPGCGGCNCVYQEQIAVVPPPGSSVHLTKVHGDAADVQLPGDLTSNQVYSQRLILPTEMVSLNRWDRDYMPTVSPILTSRRTVTRLWTEHKKGTSPTNQAFHFESKGSNNASVGAVISLRVPHENAWKFRNRYSGQTLEQIADTVVRNYIQTELSKRFQNLPFESEDKAKEPKDWFTQAIPICNEVREEARAYFAQDGILITEFGMAGGFTPDTKSNQLKLDDSFIAAEQVHVERIRNKEMEVRNRMMVAKAEAEREAAALRYEAKEAVKLRELFNAVLREQRAINDAAMKWGGVERSPEGTGFKGGGKGQLPTGMMPANTSPLGWLQGNNPEQMLEQLPKELDPKLAKWAEGLLEEIKKQREAEKAKQLEEEKKKNEKK